MTGKRGGLQTVLLLALAVSRCLAGDSSTDFSRNWHQFRGPEGTGLAQHGDPPVTWSESENVQWKVDLPGEGHASPIVWQDQIFVLTAIETDRRVDSLAPPAQEPPGGYKTGRPLAYYQFVVICIDRETGELLWQDVAREALPHEGRHATNSYASGSPTTDGERLYVSFGSQGIFCYDLQGRKLWERDLGRMITRSGWGEGASPVIYRDSLIVNWDHEGESFLIVLDPASGETKWRVERDEVSSWVTPCVVEYQGTTQVIVPTTRRITSYDLASGQILWETKGLTVNAIPCPVVYQDHVICMSGYQRSVARAIRLSARGDLSDSEQRIVWQWNRNTPYVPSPLLYGNLLYFSRSNSAVLSCLDAATGEALADAVRLPGLSAIYASPVAAAGRIYITSREGVTLVIENSPALTVLATNRLDDDIDATPAIVGRELFIRSSNHLYKIAAPIDKQP
jgi:outer membrane protein assembly factor BamB